MTKRQDMRFNNFNWKDNKLFFFTQDTGYSIVSDSEFFRVRWPDGVLSADFYNLTRAKDNTVKTYMLDQI